MNTDVPRRVRGQMSGPIRLDPGEAHIPAISGSSSGLWGATSSRIGATRATEPSVVLPAPLRWLLEVVLEQRWPQAVEDDLHSAADAWHHLGGQIAEAYRATEPAAGAIVAYNAGPGVDGFAQFWERFATGPIPRAVSVCGQLEQMLRQFADDVAEVKAYILRQLEILADEVRLRVSATGITLGVSDTTAKAAATTTRAAITAALAELSARTAATARTGTAARVTATELLNDPTVATLRQLDPRRTLDPRQWTHHGTLGTATGSPDAQPRIGPTSLVRTPIQDGGNQFTDNSPRPLTDAAHTSAHPRPGDADSPATATLPAIAPTAAAATVAAARGSLISRAMAGEG